MFCHHWLNKLSSEENKIPEHRLKPEGCQGPPHKNKVKWYEIVLSIEGSL